MTSYKRIFVCFTVFVTFAISLFEIGEAQYGVPYGARYRRPPVYSPYQYRPYSYPVTPYRVSSQPARSTTVKPTVPRVIDEDPGFATTSRSDGGISTTALYSPRTFQEPEWTPDLIRMEDRSHDFKTIAKDSLAEHRFVINNPYVDTIRITKYESSCTCTIPYLLDDKSEIKTYEDGIIVARFVTDSFVGPKSATITVTVEAVDKTFAATFQLHVVGNVRADLSMTPNSIIRWTVKNFPTAEGPNPKKTGVSRDVTVAYSGSLANWTIVDFKSSSEFLSAELIGTERTSRQKNCKVKITLSPEIPEGRFDEHITFITNDREGFREIPYHVQGIVGDSITVSPQPVFLGYLQPGEASPQKSVTVSGTRPFTITKITSSNPEVKIEFDVSANTTPRSFFALPIKYTNPIEGEHAPKDGKLEATVTLETSIPGQNPTFGVHASTKGITK